MKDTQERESAENEFWEEVVQSTGQVFWKVSGESLAGEESSDFCVSENGRMKFGEQECDCGGSVVDSKRVNGTLRDESDGSAAVGVFGAFEKSEDKVNPPSLF